MCLENIILFSCNIWFNSKALKTAHHIIVFTWKASLVMLVCVFVSWTGFAHGCNSLVITHLIEEKCWKYAEKHVAHTCGSVRRDIWPGWLSPGHTDWIQILSFQSKSSSVRIRLRKHLISVNTSQTLQNHLMTLSMCSCCVFVCFSDLLSSDYVEIFYEGGKPVQWKVWMMHLLFTFLPLNNNNE